MGSRPGPRAIPEMSESENEHDVYIFVGVSSRWGIGAVV